MKFTTEKVIEELTWMLSYTREHKAIAFLNEIVEHKPYSTNAVHSWVDTHSMNDKIVSLYEKIEDVLSQRIVKNISDGTLNPKIGELALKSFHHWKDKQSVEVDSTFTFVFPEDAKDV